MPGKLDTSILAKADSAHVISFLSTVIGKPVGSWLAPNHPGSNGQLPRLWKTVDKLSDLERVQVTAASAPLHCLDGWAYVSRAMAALLAGDVHAARHLAYYAQLRAGISILNNLGIGIFNGINFVVRSDGSTERVDPAQAPSGKGVGTHHIVWDALDAISRDSRMANLILEGMPVRDSTLADCLAAIWPSYSSLSAAGELIAAWGVDLRRGKREHVFRNISSYAPTALNPLTCNPAAAVEFISSAWSLFEPAAGSGFDALDKHILRSVLNRQKQMFEENGYATHSIAHRYDELTALVRGLASRDFLTGATDPEVPIVLTYARSAADPAEPEHMISRALLLLRVALGVTVSSLMAAGYGIDGPGLRPLLDPIAAAKGFVDPSAPAEAMSDLWDDVTLALEELTKAAQPSVASLHTWLGRKPVGLPTVSEGERIALWGLCA